MNKHELAYISGLLGGIRYPYWVPVMSVFLGIYGINWQYIQDMKITIYLN